MYRREADRIPQMSKSGQQQGDKYEELFFPDFQANTL